MAQLSQITQRDFQYKQKIENLKKSDHFQKIRNNIRNNSFSDSRDSEVRSYQKVPEPFQSSQPTLGPWKGKLVPESVPDTSVAVSPEREIEQLRYQKKEKIENLQKLVVQNKKPPLVRKQRSDETKRSDSKGKKSAVPKAMRKSASKQSIYEKMKNDDPTPKLSRKSSIKTDLENKYYQKQNNKKVQKLMKVVSHSQSSKLKEQKKKLEPYQRRPYDPKPIVRNTSRKSLKPEKKLSRRNSSLMVYKKPIIPVRHTKKTIAAKKPISDIKSVKSSKSAKKRNVKPIDIIKKAEKDERSS